MEKNSNKKTGFCWNSRKWICFMMKTPKNCPLYQEQLCACEKCGYYEERKMTKYVVRKLRILQGLFQ